MRSAISRKREPVAVIKKERPASRGSGMAAGSFGRRERSGFSEETRSVTSTERFPRFARPSPASRGSCPPRPADEPRRRVHRSGLLSPPAFSALLCPRVLRLPSRADHPFSPSRRRRTGRAFDPSVCRTGSRSRASPPTSGTGAAPAATHKPTPDVSESANALGPSRSALSPAARVREVRLPTTPPKGKQHRTGLSATTPGIHLLRHRRGREVARRTPMRRAERHGNRAMPGGGGSPILACPVAVDFLSLPTRRVWSSHAAGISRATLDSPGRSE